MRVYQLNYSDVTGGAARAAYRIHHALIEYGIDSTMFVNQSTAGDWTVSSERAKLSKMFIQIKPSIASLITKTLVTQNPITHSPANIPTKWAAKLNSSTASVVHLHWINNEMISIADIGKINKPVVWSLHDMWPFCGAEHYTEDFRWRDGYLKDNRPPYERGFDLNRWTSIRKLKHWKVPMNIVASTRWLADCASKSLLMRGWPVTVIPYAIDVSVWKPMDKLMARKLLNLPLHAHLILFGAIGGKQDPRKGFDLLEAAIKELPGYLPKLELVIFGQLKPKNAIDLPFPVHYTGHLYDDISMRILYCAADVMIVPSRQEAFGQTGTEAQCCGTPVVTFDATGLRDIVVHMQTGYLANPFSHQDLANGIKWVLEDEIRQAHLSAKSRQRAVQLWSNEVIAKQYMNVYQQAIHNH